MRRMTECHPAVIALWFLCVTGIAMFCNVPAVTAITFWGGLLFFLVRNGTEHGRLHMYLFLLLLILAIANPLVSHNGVTVLFILNHNPVTLEALLYGINAAVMIVGVLYWFRSFTQIMTSEKLLYLTGMLSPKLALVISMALRFVPLFTHQASKIDRAQRAMGLYQDDNAIDGIRGKMRVFSVLITWALENGITTADSMEARGFGIGRRTSARRFHMKLEDVCLLLVTALLTGLVACVIATGRLRFSFYPAITFDTPDLLGWIGLIAYSILVLLPTGMEVGVNVRWRYLQSQI